MTQAAPQMPIYMQRDGIEPVAALRRIREDERVLRLGNPYGIDAFLVTRYDDVREVLTDPARFSNRRPARLAEFDDRSPEEVAQARAGNLLAMDPPEQHRLRRMLAPEFTVRRIRRLEPRIAEVVDDHLDAMEQAGAPAELVSAFALPLPSLVICELLGVPYVDRAGFQARTSRQLDMSLPPRERTALAHESRIYMDGLVTAARTDPGDDLIGMLVREHGAELTQDELVGIANLLLEAGHETTSNMLGLGTFALLQHPDQLAIVRDEPDAVGPAVEELLRWLSIVHSGLPRFAVADTEIGGVAIPAGAMIILSLPAADRDPAFVDDPDRLDVRRGAIGHVAFGHGVHHCLGAPLARVEMTIAFPALVRRFPRLALAGDPADAPFRAFHFVFGLERLEVTW
ncbi:Cytochrome P450 [Pseudonocardia thermophila]|uniref:Cytochrome P450 n=1 Tax=Pseudonocardia thermophila TaxID=1848 RepID=A0A1M6TZM2_PSETH|nr:cytochrome P450 [Pseudonocardia thermophila]SHK62278.1 Cytochrome P450 [Pseudonocardia thermophila]